jgi:hypothetical protein
MLSQCHMFDDLTLTLPFFSKNTEPNGNSSIKCIWNRGINILALASGLPHSSLMRFAGSKNMVGFVSIFSGCELDVLIYREKCSTYLHILPDFQYLVRQMMELVRMVN